MAVYISFCPIGVFAVDEEKKQIASALFDRQKCFEGMAECEKATLSEAETKVVSQIKPSGKIVFERKKQDYEHEFPNKAGEYLRQNLENLAIKHGFAKTKAEFSEFMSEFAVKKSSEDMVSSFSEDKLVIQAVSTIDELDKMLNTLSMRLREWYGFYFPELVEKMQDNEQFVGFVSDTLYRKEVAGIDPAETIGSDLSKKDLDEISAFAKSLKAIYAQRKSAEKYIDGRMGEIMPNTSRIIGGVSAARLLSIAGSLEKLAKFPSSTIQILGAEKALFRHIVAGGRSPKYGILFQTSYIQQAPQNKKGKMARLLASKLSMAIKIDFYKGASVGEDYKKELDSDLAKLKKER